MSALHSQTVAMSASSGGIVASLAMACGIPMFCDRGNRTKPVESHRRAAIEPVPGTVRNGQEGLCYDRAAVILVGGTRRRNGMIADRVTRTAAVSPLVRFQDIGLWIPQQRTTEDCHGSLLMAYSVVITQAKLMSIVHNTRSFVDHRRAEQRGTFLCKEIVHGCGKIRYRRERKIKGIYVCHSDQQATSPV